MAFVASVAGAAVCSVPPLNITLAVVVGSDFPAGRNAVAFAVEQLQSQPLCPERYVSVRHFEDPCDPDAARALARELLRANVTAVIGFGCSGALSAASEVLQSEGGVGGQFLPVISADATALSVRNTTAHGNVWVMAPDDGAQSAVIAQLIRRYRWGTCAVLATDTAYGREGAALLTAALSGGVTRVTVVPTPLVAPGAGVAEWRNTTDALKRSNTRCVVTFLHLNDLQTALTAAYDSGLYGAGYAYVLSDTAAAVPARALVNSEEVMRVLNGALLLQQGAAVDTFYALSFAEEFTARYSHTEPTNGGGGATPTPSLSLVDQPSIKALFDATRLTLTAIDRVCTANSGDDCPGGVIRASAANATRVAFAATDMPGTSTARLQFVPGTQSLANGLFCVKTQYGLTRQIIATTATAVSGSSTTSSSSNASTSTPAAPVLTPVAAPPPIRWPGDRTAPPSIQTYRVLVMTAPAVRELMCSGADDAVREVVRDRLLEGDALQYVCMDDGGPSTAGGIATRARLEALMNDGGPPVIAIFGPYYTQVALWLCPWAAARHIVVIGTDKMGAELSDTSRFPMYLGMQADSMPEIRAMTRAIAESGAQRLALVVTADAFSKNGGAELATRCQRHGVAVTRCVARNETDRAGLRDCIDHFARNGLRFVVAFGHGETFMTLITEAYTAGYFGSTAGNAIRFFSSGTYTYDLLGAWQLAVLDQSMVLFRQPNRALEQSQYASAASQVTGDTLLRAYTYDAVVTLVQAIGDVKARGESVVGASGVGGNNKVLYNAFRAVRRFGATGDTYFAVDGDGTAMDNLRRGESVTYALLGVSRAARAMLEIAQIDPQNDAYTLSPPPPPPASPSAPIVTVPSGIVAACDGGTAYLSVNGTFRCVPCPAGTYAGPNSVACTPCPATIAAGGAQVPAECPFASASPQRASFAADPIATGPPRALSPVDDAWLRNGVFWAVAVPMFWFLGLCFVLHIAAFAVLTRWHNSLPPPNREEVPGDEPFTPAELKERARVNALRDHYMLWQGRVVKCDIFLDHGARQRHQSGGAPTLVGAQLNVVFILCACAGALLIVLMRWKTNNQVQVEDYPGVNSAEPRRFEIAATFEGLDRPEMCAASCPAPYGSSTAATGFGVSVVGGNTNATNTASIPGVWSCTLLDGNACRITFVADHTPDDRNDPSPPLLPATFDVRMGVVGSHALRWSSVVRSDLAPPSGPLCNRTDLVYGWPTTLEPFTADDHDRVLYSSLSTPFEANYVIRATDFRHSEMLFDALPDGTELHGYLVYPISTPPTPGQSVGAADYFRSTATTGTGDAAADGSSSGDQQLLGVSVAFHVSVSESLRLVDVVPTDPLGIGTANFTMTVLNGVIMAFTVLLKLYDWNLYRRQKEDVGDYASYGRAHSASAARAAVFDEKLGELLNAEAKRKRRRQQRRRERLQRTAEAAANHAFPSGSSSAEAAVAGAAVATAAVASVAAPRRSGNAADRDNDDDDDDDDDGGEVVVIVPNPHTSEHTPNRNTRNPKSFIPVVMTLPAAAPSVAPASASAADHVSITISPSAAAACPVARATPASPAFYTAPTPSPSVSARSSPSSSVSPTGSPSVSVSAGNSGGVRRVSALQLDSSAVAGRRSSAQQLARRRDSECVDPTNASGCVVC